MASQTATNSYLLSPELPLAIPSTLIPLATTSINTRPLKTSPMQQNYVNADEDVVDYEDQEEEPILKPIKVTSEISNASITKKIELISFNSNDSCIPNSIEVQLNEKRNFNNSHSSGAHKRLKNDSNSYSDANSNHPIQSHDMHEDQFNQNAPNTSQLFYCTSWNLGKDVHLVAIFI